MAGGGEQPPFHSGVKTDTSMTEQFLREVAQHLEPGGELRLVANSFLPYESEIQRQIGAVEKLAQDRRFTVYRAFRRGGAGVLPIKSPWGKGRKVMSEKYRVSGCEGPDTVTGKGVRREHL